MASLALVVSIIMLSFWFVAGASLLLTFLGCRLLGAVFGGFSVVAGVWLLCVLPHVPFLGLINLVAGWVSIRRYFSDSYR